MFYGKIDFPPKPWSLNYTYKFLFGNTAPIGNLKTNIGKYQYLLLHLPDVANKVK